MSRDCDVHRILVSSVDNSHIHGYAEPQVSDDLLPAAPLENAPAVDIAINDSVRTDAVKAEGRTCNEHCFSVRLVLFMSVVAFIISHLIIF